MLYIGDKGGRGRKNFEKLKNDTSARPERASTKTQEQDMVLINHLLTTFFMNLIFSKLQRDQ